MSLFTNIFDKEVMTAVMIAFKLYPKDVDVDDVIYPSTETECPFRLLTEEDEEEFGEDIPHLNSVINYFWLDHAEERFMEYRARSMYSLIRERKITKSKKFMCIWFERLVSRSLFPDENMASFFNLFIDYILKDTLEDKKINSFDLKLLSMFKQIWFRMNYCAETGESLHDYPEEWKKMSVKDITLQEMYLHAFKEFPNFIENLDVYEMYDENLGNFFDCLFVDVMTGEKEFGKLSPEEREILAIDFKWYLLKSKRTVKLDVVELVIDEIYSQGGDDFLCLFDKLDTVEEVLEFGTRFLFHFVDMSDGVVWTVLTKYFEFLTYVMKKTEMLDLKPPLVKSTQSFLKEMDNMRTFGWSDTSFLVDFYEHLFYTITTNSEDNPIVFDYLKMFSQIALETASSELKNHTFNFSGDVSTHPTTKYFHKLPKFFQNLSDYHGLLQNKKTPEKVLTYGEVTGFANIFEDIGPDLYSFTMSLLKLRLDDNITRDTLLQIRSTLNLPFGDEDVLDEIYQKLELYIDDLRMKPIGSLLLLIKEMYMNI